MEDEFNLQMFSFLLGKNHGYLFFGSVLILIFSIRYFFTVKKLDHLIYDEIFQKLSKRSRDGIDLLFNKKKSLYFDALQDAIQKELKGGAMSHFRAHLVNYRRMLFAKWLIFISVIMIVASLLYEREWLAKLMSSIFSF